MEGRGRIYAQKIGNFKESVFVEKVLKELKEGGKLQTGAGQGWHWGWHWGCWVLLRGFIQGKLFCLPRDVNQAQFWSQGSYREIRRRNQVLLCCPRLSPLSLVPWRARGGVCAPRGSSPGGWELILLHGFYSGAFLDQASPRLRVILAVVGAVSPLICSRAQGCPTAPCQ